MAKVLQCHYPSLSKTHLILHISLVLTIFQTHNFHFSHSSKPIGFSLKLIPRDLPESPLYPGNLTQTQRLQRLINFSKAREQYLIYSASSTKPENIQMEIFKDKLFYVVQTILGRPSNVQYLLMDTGSGLIWTQCQPCKTCFPQTHQIYDSKASSSYQKLPCSHPLCNGGPKSQFNCVNDECIYSATYNGGKQGPTKGVASIETFRFGKDNGTILDIDGIVFGCSNDNTNFGFQGTSISGIFGLSWAPISLMTQLADKIERRFSYCLVAADAQGQARPSLLTFGSSIPSPVGNVQTTRFVEHPPHNYFYYLNLLDISVGLDRLGFPSDTFKMNQDGTRGTFIDSGALSSFLNSKDLPNGRNPYKEVIGAFQKFYDSKNLKRKGDALKGLELCYEKPAGDFNQYATMTYHFAGADYVVDGKYVNYFNNQRGYFCVLLKPGDGISILGAWHQQNKRIIYNANIFGLQFVDEQCK